MSTYSSAHISVTNDFQCGQVNVSFNYPGATSWSATLDVYGNTTGTGSGSGMAIGGPAGTTGNISVSWLAGTRLIGSESVAYTYGTNAPSPPSGSVTLSGSVDQSTGTASLSWVGTVTTGTGSTPTFALNRDGTFAKNVTGTGTVDTPPRGWHSYTVTPVDSNTCGTSTGTVSNALSLLYNSPPNAPILVNPPSSAVVNPGVVQRLTWQFNDPDVPDAQSAFDVQYRIVGTSTWTSASGQTPNNFYDIAAGALSLQSYEWQVRTYDSLGAVGPWSASGFFSTATPPAGPTITAPVNGATVGGASLVVNWSASAQASYEVRRVADNGSGAADTATVYSDTGEVFSTARTATIPLTVNNRREHVQVRVRNGGPWSNWADANYLVTFTPPAAPLILLTGFNGTTRLDPPRIEVAVSNPLPTGTQPPVASMDIFRSTAGGPLERVAVNQPPFAIYVDYRVASGVDYAYQARVYSANGLFADSALTNSHVTVSANTYGGYDSGY